MFAQAIEVKEFTPELLIFLLGIVQSLFFEYVPKVEEWYGALGDKFKRLLQAGVLLVITLAIFGLGCADIVGGVECSNDSLYGLVFVYFLALTANQTTHRVFRREHADPN
jgi:hypothetical protein